MEAQKTQSPRLLALKIRRDVLAALAHFGSGHVGGSLSVADLFAVLYADKLTYDPQNPTWDGRDRVILSKGHAGPAWYAALANSGFFSREDLLTLNQAHTNLPSHPDRTKTPGVDATTGSLGQGTSVAAGIALGLKRQGNTAYTYVIVGDGELDEGQCWEAFQFMAHYGLDHIIVVVDENHKQLDGYTKDVINPQDIAAKMEAFGFETQKVDGQDLNALQNAIDAAKAREGKPHAIVMQTTKGAGVAYFEELMDNHSVPFSGAALEAANAAIADFDAQIAQIEKGA